MSVDLRNKNGEKFYFSTTGWMFYLNLAAVGYCWERQGTSAPDDWPGDGEAWSSAYDWNAGQKVEDSDALQLSKSLGRYLADPNGKELAQNIASEIGEMVGFEIQVDANDNEYIASFIRFAEQGGFQVW